MGKGSALSVNISEAAIERAYVNACKRWSRALEDPADLPLRAVMAIGLAKGLHDDRSYLDELLRGDD